MAERWSDERVLDELSRVVEEKGRMPTSTELRVEGGSRLLGAICWRGGRCAISRGHGFREWAMRLRVEQKGHHTHRGQKWERHEAAFLRSMGLPVEEQTTRAPFDLMVNGHRVDVKSSTWKSYDCCTGYFFNNFKFGEDCDFFDLVCVSEGVDHRFVIPADEIRLKSVTIAPSSLTGKGPGGKWWPFKDALDVLK